MISNELIKSFFVEHFQDVSAFFLYKDHQLLKADRFQEFIERQLIKSRKRFVIGIVLVITGLILGLTYFWMYHVHSDIVHLVLAIFWIMMAASYLFWFTKQYYIISGSMSLLQKMLEKQELPHGGE